MLEWKSDGWKERKSCVSSAWDAPAFPTPVIPTPTIPTPAIPTPVIPTPVLAAHFSKIHALEHFIYKQSTVGLTLRLKAT